MSCLRTGGVLFGDFCTFVYFGFDCVVYEEVVVTWLRLGFRVCFEFCWWVCQLCAWIYYF